MKNNFKFLLAFLIFVGLIGGFSGYSRAAEDPYDPCTPTALAYTPGLSFFELNIQRTIYNFLIGVVINLYTNISGLDPDKTVLCTDYIIEKTVNLIPLGDTVCHVSDTATDDEKAQINYTCDAFVSDMGGRSAGVSSVYVNSVNSSMLGFGTMLEGAARKGPLPVNFAYYWNQNVTKIPFAGRALAADGGYDNLPVVKAMYSIWSISLKASLALLSVVLLYTGIMITMGKKLSTQLVVSVQYAIPKIVIGTILMIFSYPIGAAITSISFGLFKGAFPMVFNLLLGQGNGGTGSGVLLMGLLIMTLNIARGGMWYLIVAIIMLLIMIIAKWIIYIKVIIIYIKMAFSIVTAPFEFVVGTIPGNDDKIKDWFMRMLKYGLTLFGMGLIIPITLWVGLQIMSVYMGEGQGFSEVGGWGVAISLIAPILIVVLGFGFGIGMESRVDGILNGGKKKR